MRGVSANFCAIGACLAKSWRLIANGFRLNFQRANAALQRGANVAEAAARINYYFWPSEQKFSSALPAVATKATEDLPEQKSSKRR
jgi:hypothetical protein